MTGGSAGLTAFISYAPEDDALRQELEKHLALLQHQGLLRTWSDRQIVPGNERSLEIDDKLVTADLIFLLISHHFNASEPLWEREMKFALARHDEGTTRVIPVILRPCDWRSTPYGQLQVLPGNLEPVTPSAWKNRDEVLERRRTRCARGVRERVSRIRKDAGRATP